MILAEANYAVMSLESISFCVWLLNWLSLKSIQPWELYHEMYDILG
jgi:hypothetical protein